MEFKIDENLPVEVADLLRQVGYDAITVLEQHLEAHPIPISLLYARKKGVS